jgi:hypothetical protein
MKAALFTLSLLLTSANAFAGNATNVAIWTLSRIQFHDHTYVCTYHLDKKTDTTHVATVMQKEMCNTFVHREVEDTVQVAGPVGHIDPRI